MISCFVVLPFKKYYQRNTTLGGNCIPLTDLIPFSTIYRWCGECLISEVLLFLYFKV